MLLFQLWDVAATTRDGESLLLLYGRASVADGGQDVCIRVRGFKHYIYIPQPAMTSVSSSPVEAIEAAMRRRNLFSNAELVTRTDAVGFNVPANYWKLTLRNHQNVYQLRDAINQGDIASNFSRKSYLSDFPYTSLAQVDLGLANCGWASIDQAKLLGREVHGKMTSCVLEYELDHIDERTSQPNIKPLPETEWAAMPTRLHVASLDIECAGRRGIFPDPLVDPIIQIGTLVMLHGAAPNTPPLSFTIYTWRTASTPACGYYEAGGHRAEYVVCRDESDMIAKWVKLMRDLRVDLYTGWNTDDFDLPYIVRRAGALTPQPDLCGLGRRLNTRIVAKPTKFSSKQLGSRESYSLEGIEGVHFLDMCIEVMRSRKERSYKLDYISRVVLAHKNIYELSLVESLWLKEVRSVQILGLGSKKCDWLESPLLFASGRLVDVVDRSTHATLPLVAGDYRLVLSRPQKEQRLFMRFFNEAGRCIGFATCPRASDMHKEDIHYTRITELWNGSDDDRRMLAVYNLVDAMLPWQNMCELRTLGTLIEMARVSKTDITQQMQKGQNVKSTMLLQWEAKAADFIVPYLPPRIKEKMGNCEPVPDSLWYRHDLDAAARAGTTVAEEIDAADDDVDGGGDGPTLEAGKGKTKYTGGYVGEMEARYYGPDEPVHTVDFESLYPSLMMSHNLCPTTMVMDRSQLAKAHLTLDRDCVQSPIEGVYFVKHEVRRGLLPVILDKILGARKAAKRAMAAATDIGEKQSLDGRQLALKITANSVYGFTGNSKGTLPCLYVAAAVTTYGKQAILFSKGIVESEWPTSKVIYIDTDSLFVRDTNCKTVAESMECGLAQSKRVTELFMAQSPHNRRVLAFEKVNCPFLGLCPKRYASLYWTKTDDPDMIYERGVETVRRDVPLLVAELMSAVFFLILRCGDIEAACEIVRLVVSQLWLCEVPMSKLIMAKEYAKEVYANLQPHAQVAAKMARRDPASAPKLGDRIQYVVTPHDKKTNVSLAAESPDYCVKNNIYPDQPWYIDQLETCISRVMVPVIGAERTRELFHGDHTRRRKTLLPTSGGLFNFVKRGAEAEAINAARAAGGGGGGGEFVEQPVAAAAPKPQVAVAAAAPPAKRQKKAVAMPANGGIMAFFSKK